MKSSYLRFLNQKTAEYIATKSQSSGLSEAGPKAYETPLADRLKRLISDIPQDEQKIPRGIEWFRVRLKGRGGRGAHPGELGLALRNLGWKRKRSWSNAESGFRALWIPPDS